MKKILLLLAVVVASVLPGCGEVEEDTPKIVWTSPANGATSSTVGGAILTIQFNTEMDISTLDYGTVSLIDTATGDNWPLVDDTGAPVAGTITASSDDQKQFIFTVSDFIKSPACYNATVSQYVRSISGATMDAPYRFSFCTN